MGKKINIQVITSFNQTYYDIIGKDAVRSWLQHWPQDMALTCYVENMRLKDQSRIKQIGFDQLGPQYQEFQQIEFKGRVRTFAKKAFVLIHAMQHCAADRVVWLDADVLTTKTMDPAVLHQILPDNVVSTHLGVTYKTDTHGQTPGSWFVPETGVFALNTKHAEFAKFRDEYTRRYHDRDFEGLRRSYDNDVYGAVISDKKIPSLDLCAELKKGYKTPLRHTVLGPYLHHYKAKHSKDWFAQAADQ
jgi:hypothetical protein